MGEPNDAFVQRIENLEKRVAELESRHNGSKNAAEDVKGAKTQSIREFILTKNLSTANDHTLALGYYVEQLASQSFFSADDIKAAYRSAKLPGPKNVNDTINKNIVKGFMMESGLRDQPVKTWVLTASGEEYVEKELNRQE